MENNKIDTKKSLFLGKKVEDTIVLNILTNDSKKLIIDNQEYQQIFFTKESDYRKAITENQKYKLVISKLTFLGLNRIELRHESLQEQIESKIIPNEITIKKWVYSKDFSPSMSINKIMLIVTIEDIDYVYQIKPYLFYDFLQYTTMSNTEFLNTSVHIVSEKTRDFLVTPSQLESNIQRIEKLENVELKIGNVYEDEKTKVNYIYLGKYPMFNFSSVFKNLEKYAEDYGEKQFKKTLKPIWIKESEILQQVSNENTAEVFTNTVEDIEKIIRWYMTYNLSQSNMHTINKFIENQFKLSSNIVAKRFKYTLFTIENEEVANTYVQNEYLKIFSEYINGLAENTCQLIKTSTDSFYPIINEYTVLLNIENPYSILLFDRLFSNIHYSIRNQFDFLSKIKNTYTVSFEQKVWKKCILDDFQKFSYYLIYSYQEQKKIIYFKQFLDLLLITLETENNKPTVNDILNIVKPKLQQALVDLNQLTTNFLLNCPTSLQNLQDMYQNIFNVIHNNCSTLLTEMSEEE